MLKPAVFLLGSWLTSLALKVYCISFVYLFKQIKAAFSNKKKNLLEKASFCRHVHFNKSMRFVSNKLALQTLAIWSLTLNFLTNLSGNVLIRVK